MQSTETELWGILWHSWALGDKVLSQTHPAQDTLLYTFLCFVFLFLNFMLNLRNIKGVQSCIDFLMHVDHLMGTGGTNYLQKLHEQNV